MHFAFDAATWGWPQWTLLSLLFFDLVFASVMHGKPRDNPNWSAFTMWFSVVLWICLLGFGGFFA